MSKWEVIPLSGPHVRIQHQTIDVSYVMRCGLWYHLDAEYCEDWFTVVRQCSPEAWIALPRVVYMNGSL